MNVFPLDLFPLSWGICNPRGGHCGYVIRADALFISFLHDQKRNRTKEKSHRLIAKKLKAGTQFTITQTMIQTLSSGICNPRGSNLRMFHPRGSQTRS